MFNFTAHGSNCSPSNAGRWRDSKTVGHSHLGRINYTLGSVTRVDVYAGPGITGDTECLALRAAPRWQW